MKEPSADFFHQPSPGTRVFRAPGRVNLIGDHTDYNDGFVLPAALDFSTWVSITPRNDRMLSVFSENFSEEIELNLDDLKPEAIGHWSDYVKGLAFTLDQSGYRLWGASLLIRGDIPIGSGLSSSAALAVAVACALLGNAGLQMDQRELAQLCQRAENEFVGTRCGIMDFFISCFGREANALLLDCRSLEYRLISVPGETRLVICNTMVKHSHVNSGYNDRRIECETGMRQLAQNVAGLHSLRDLSESDLEGARRDLPEPIYRRCRHVLTENARVIDAATALERRDLPLFGDLMDKSHRSLRDDYEVSCAELDLMVELAREVEGVYGARMTGGGFGGCTINLVDAKSVECFRKVVKKRYEESTGIVPEIYVCSPAAGAQEIDAH
jgi:galactokinase